MPSLTIHYGAAAPVHQSLPLQAHSWEATEAIPATSRTTATVAGSQTMTIGPKNGVIGKVPALYWKRQPDSGAKGAAPRGRP